MRWRRKAKGLIELNPKRGVDKMDKLNIGSGREETEEEPVQSDEGAATAK